MVKNGCCTKYIREPTDRQARMDSMAAAVHARHYVPVTNGGGGIDGYMRNYGLAQFQREAKKKPPQYVMTHIWLTSLRKREKESEASVAQ